MSQQFCLKWNNHTTNMLQVFENLLTTEALVDVTLACDGLSLKAHKMVLSACSPFFQSLFLENPCKHPIVIMKDMRYCDLKAIIDFMYRGEVNVSHDQLSALLKTAETLKVKGLAEVTGENKHASGIVQQEIIQQNSSTPTPVPPSAQRTDTPPLQGKRKRGRPRKRSLSDSNRSDDEGVPAKIKEPNSDIEELSGDASMEATSDTRSGGGPISSNSLSQVPIHSSNNVNTFSKSHLSSSQDPQVEEPESGDENEFEVEPSKLLEQTLTTENVPSNSQNSTGHITLPSVSGLEISRRSMSSTDSVSQALVPVSDSLGSNLQGPDSPQDVKPQILSFDDPPISPVAGTSHGSADRSLMMYMDQSGVASIPGPSNFQDNSALVPHDSQPQGFETNCNVKMEELVAESDDIERDQNFVNISSWDEPDFEELPTTSRVRKWLFTKPKRENLSTLYQNNDQLPNFEDAPVILASTLVKPSVSVNLPQCLVPYSSRSSSTESESEKTPIKEKKLTRKRMRNSKDWKVSVNTRLHQSGQEYTNNRGINIPKKSIKYNKNCSNCKFKCNTKVSQEEREGLFTSYYEIPSHAEKIHYILKTTDSHTPCRSTIHPKSISRKKKSFKYNFFIGNDKIQVCKRFYLDTLSISQKTIYNAHNNKNSLTGIPKEDNRGKMTKDKIKKSEKDYVRQHIASFPKAESHYCRCKSNKEYLDPLLNVRKMYELYTENCVTNQMDPVKLSMYRKIFKEEFNLEFLTPKSDRCDMCEEYKMSKTENRLTKELEEKYEEHIKQRINESGMKQ